MAREIRQLTIADYDSIIRTWAVAGLPYRPKGRDSRELLVKELEHPDVTAFGLYENGAMIGVAIANYDGRRGWVNRLAVDPDFRGQGCALALIERCEEFLHSRGALVICALIDDDNYPSISTFQKAGYHCHEDLRYFSKRPSDDV